MEYTSEFISKFTLYKFACGPFFYTAEIIFLLGFVWHFGWAIKKYLNTSDLWTNDKKIDEKTGKKKDIKLPNNKHIFEVLAKRHKLLSQLWFTISITILFGGDIYAFFHVMESPCAKFWTECPANPSASWSEVPEKILPNLFLYSLFFVAWGWSLRNYKAHWHNFITNEHRFASLTTIDEIRRDKDTPQDIKNELARQASVAVLIPSESAYLEGEGEKEITSAERLLKVEEAIRELITHGKPHKRRWFF